MSKYPVDDDAYEKAALKLAMAQTHIRRIQLGSGDDLAAAIAARGNAIAELATLEKEANHV